MWTVSWSSATRAVIQVVDFISSLWTRALSPGPPATRVVIWVVI